MYDTSYYSSSYSTNAAAGIMGATFITYLIVVLVCSLGVYVISSFLLSRIFKKAGQKTSTAWIPIYNMWKFLELGDQKGFWIFIPFANVVFTYIAMYHIGKKLGKDDSFVLLAIFIQIVWLIILGFDKSVWNGGTATTESLSANQPTADAPVIAAPVAEEAPAAEAPEEPMAPEQPAYTAPVASDTYASPVAETPAVGVTAPTPEPTPEMAPIEPVAAPTDYSAPAQAAYEAPVADTTSAEPTSSAEPTTDQNTDIQ